MAFVAAPNIVHLAAVYTLQGQRCENTWHYLVTAAKDRAKLQAMATTHLNWFVAHVGLYSNALGLELIYVRDLSSQSGQTLDFVPTSTTDGTRAAELLPNNVTLAIKRETGLAGRKNRGRIYWPGINSDEVTGTNTIIGGTGAALATALNTLLLAQFTDNGAVEVVYHRATGTGTPVVGYTLADFFLDSQRRRLPGHNRHH